MNTIGSRTTSVRPVMHDVVSTPSDDAARVSALARTLTTTGKTLYAALDRRGLFFTMYARCVHRIADEMARGTFAEPAAVARVVEGLGTRALAGLEEPKGAWAKATTLATSDASDARVLGAGMNAHLTVDLPLSIVDARVGPRFSDDLQKLGRALVDETERIRSAPQGGDEERLVATYDALPLVPMIERAFGTTAVRDTAYSIVLNEATAQARLLGLVPAARPLLDLAAGHRERVMDVWLRRSNDR